MSSPSDRRVVYKTGIGRVRTCATCGQPEGSCRCRAERRGDAGSSARPGMPNDGIVRIARDRKGRGGKTMTIITGLPHEDALLTRLAQTFKRLCGSGGTVTEDGVIEIQGDHRDRLEAKLAELGYTVKRVGG